MDRAKLHKGFQIYLTNAEKASGKTYNDMALVLSKSGLKKHGELRSHLMARMGLGHGHANAIVGIWLQPDNGGPEGLIEKAPAKGPVVKTVAKPAAKKKAVAAKATAKPPAKKPAAKKAAAKKK